MPNICNFVECDESIRSDHHLCKPHWEQEQRTTEINKCANCGQYKPSEYELCLPCKRKVSQFQKERQPGPKTQVESCRIEARIRCRSAPDPRPRKDAETDVFYVYLLHVKGDGNTTPAKPMISARDLWSTLQRQNQIHQRTRIPNWYGFQGSVHAKRQANTRRIPEKSVPENNDRAITTMVNEFLESDQRRRHDLKKTPIATDPRRSPT